MTVRVSPEGLVSSLDKTLIIVRSLVDEKDTPSSTAIRVGSGSGSMTTGDGAGFGSAGSPDVGRFVG